MNTGNTSGFTVKEISRDSSGGQKKSERRSATRAKKPEKRTGSGAGIKLSRRFTQAGTDPFDSVEWELRTANISNEKGETVFEQTDVEIPASWSQLATNVVVSKYFRGHVGEPGRERSIKELIGRVVGRITEWGVKGGYFADPEDAKAFSDELVYLLVNQKMAFNSPVWFNLGVEDTPQQAVACGKGHGYGIVRQTHKFIR